MQTTEIHKLSQATVHGVRFPPPTCVAASRPRTAMETGVHHINSFSRSIQILPITALLLLILPTPLSRSLIWKAADFSSPWREAGGGGRLSVVKHQDHPRKRERRSSKIKKRKEAARSLVKTRITPEVWFDSRASFLSPWWFVEFFSRLQTHQKLSSKNNK